jgi:hypothetical protein
MLPPGLCLALPPVQVSLQVKPVLGQTRLVGPGALQPLEAAIGLSLAARSAEAGAQLLPLQDHRDGVQMRLVLSEVLHPAHGPQVDPGQEMALVDLPPLVIPWALAAPGLLRMEQAAGAGMQQVLLALFHLRLEAPGV